MRSVVYGSGSVAVQVAAIDPPAVQRVLSPSLHMRLRRRDRSAIRAACSAALLTLLVPSVLFAACVLSTVNVPHESRHHQQQSPAVVSFRQRSFCGTGEAAQHEAFAPERHQLPPGVDRLWNPSPAVEWREGARGQPSRRALMFYRGTLGPEKTAPSTVVFRACELSAATRGACSPSGPLAWVDAPDVSREPGSAGECVVTRGGPGYQDPRAVVHGDSVLVFANIMHPAPRCQRAMAVISIALQDALVATSGTGPEARRVAPRSVTLLQPQYWNAWEKNWMPFVRNGTLHMVRTVQPHEVVRCAAPGDGRCEVVSRTSWWELPWLLGTHGRDLRGTTAVVERAEHGDFLAVGHWRDGDWYAFFWYTFQRDPPHAITGASRAFRVDEESELQFASGLEAVGDAYMLTFSVNDTTTQSRWFSRCEVDRLVTAFRPRPAI